MTQLQHTLPRVINRKCDCDPADAVYIGRPSRWGNPFQIGRDGNRHSVILQHRTWLQTQPALLARLDELRGRDLVCFCAPLPCHGYTLLWLANPDLRDKRHWPQSLHHLLASLEPLAALADAALRG